MKTITNIIYSAFALFAFACFALSPTARAVNPPPDGGYFFKNTAEGQDALFSVDPSIGSSGVENTAIGYKALYSDVDGAGNTAIGANSLYSNQSVYNTATGDDALFNNTYGTQNTASGAGALFSNTTGSNNIAIGAFALEQNATRSNNTAIGSFALNNSTGSGNTAIGYNALLGNTTGSNNIALGFRAGFNLTTGGGNVCIGQGVLGVAGESNTTRIKNVYASVASGRAVYVNSDNKIGTLVSSRRFKEEIEPMDKASEAILALKPVTFRYKKEIEPNAAIMFGLIAEDVENVAPELVTRDAKGEVETVRYEAVNAMLLNEFLKEHRRVEAQDSRLQQQQEQIEMLTAQLKEQAEQIRKVNDKVEMNRPAPHVVVDSR
jgi:hypothetical protein